jgi:DNA-binding winged helix-turn-helix (wHTH) protein/tetratricopeptide (TPR) repeat protein
MTAPAHKIYEFGPFRLDTEERVLLRDGQQVPLTLKAFDVLLMLVENSGHIVEKDQLMNRVWAGRFVEEGNLKVTVSMLRKALEENNGGTRYVETVPRRGYRFASEVKIVGGLFLLRDRTQSFVPAAGSAPIKSIAVLPFKPLVADTRDESLELGMADTLITRLSGLKEIVVRPTSAVRHYAGLEQDAIAAGREQRVDAVLDGSLQRSGERLRVTVRFLRIADGQTLWTERFDDNFTDIFAVQDRVSEKVAGALALKLGGEERARLRKHDTHSSEAYELYLKGRYFWDKFTLADHQKATEYFNQAIAKDPGYAVAYAGLADTYGASATNGWLPPHEAYPKAKLTVQKALSLDDTLAEAHANLGALFMFYDMDWVSAEREYRRAIELNPDYEGTYGVYSYLLCALGRPDEGVEKARRGLEANPLSGALANDLALAYYQARRYDEAIKQYQKQLDMEPARAEALLGLGVVYEQKGMYEQAINEYQRAIKSLGRTSPVLAQLGRAYALSGKRTEAINVVREFKEIAKQSFRGSYDSAIFYTGLGERDKAFEQLNKAYEERSGWIIYLKVEPQFDSLRTDPRYVPLLKRINISQ